MKQLSILICILFFASSCKKELTFIQKAKEDVFVRKSAEETPILIYDIDATLSASEEPTMLPILNLPTETIEPFQEKDQNWERRKKRKKVQSKKETFFEKVFPNRTESKQKPKKKPTFRRYNSFIPAGFAILGIAILLALLSLQSLSLLFGLAALLILFIGFKRFFRRKNRRKLFQ